jgi:hypothetical protein
MRLVSSLKRRSWSHRCCGSAEIWMSHGRICRFASQFANRRDGRWTKI